MAIVRQSIFRVASRGALIVLTAVSIGWAAWPRLFHPQPIEQPGRGLAISVAASILNFIVARILLAASRRYQSITLEADAHHPC